MRLVQSKDCKGVFAYWIKPKANKRDTRSRAARLPEENRSIAQGRPPPGGAEVVTKIAGEARGVGPSTTARIVHLRFEKTEGEAVMVTGTSAAGQPAAGLFAGRPAAV